jgi:hypothetical protein
MSDTSVEIDKSSQAPQDSEVRGSRTSEGKAVRRKDLLNLLNYVNFQEGTIFADFRHLKYDNHRSVQAYPRPCTDDILECRWTEPGESTNGLKDYAFDSFLLSDGHDLFRVKAEVTHMDESGITFRIPDMGHERSLRKVRRHACSGVFARVYQNGIALEGSLEDFNAVSCRVALGPGAEESIRWISPEVPVQLHLEADGRLLFTGSCAVLRSSARGGSRQLVLTPSFTNIRRYLPRDYRSQRHTLAPTPNVGFTHPLTGKRLDLQALDISSSGFATEEFFHSATLLPGLIIPEVELEIGNHFIMRCRAQVLYRNVVRTSGGDDVARCGVLFLDMSVEDQTALSALLHQNANSRSRVCNRVDMEELWRFFFESGFIYPSKYLSIRDYKDQFKETYEKLYLRSPAIARHFIFQERGIIFGHMSMIRSDANTWLIHHHAASRSGHGMAGVAVLDQVSQYINEFHLHRSTRMDYVMCYYRQENRFPSRVFGGVARDVANPKASSVDEFAYALLDELPPAKAEALTVLPAGPEDLSELERCYERRSGGLALRALNLTADILEEDDLDAEYARCGFKRRRHVFALKSGDSLLAVAAVTLTDLGLNLSNLTNCMHFFVVDEDRLSGDALVSAARGLAGHFKAREVPVLVYPASYADTQRLPYEKKYILWVFNMDSLDGYFKSIGNTFKRDVHGRQANKSDDN